MPSSARTARSSSPRSRPSTTRQRSGPSGSSHETLRPGGPADQIALKRPLAQRRGRSPHPPSTSGRAPFELGRNRGGRLPRALASAAAHRARRRRGRARAPRGPAPAPVLVSTAAPVRSPRWTTRPGQEPRHRATVAGEAPDRRDGRARARAPTRGSTSPRRPSSAARAIRSRAAFGSTSSFPSARNIPQRARSAGGRPQPPCCACRLGHLGIRLVAHGVGDTDRRSRGSPSAPPGAGSSG